MRTRHFTLILSLAMTLILVGCARQKQEVVELKAYSLDIPEGIIAQSDDLTNLQIDPQVTADGNGSLKIAVSESVTVRLFEVGDVDIENARLIYRAKLRTENVEGKVYLEMICHFPGKGDFYSRGFLEALAGTNDWITVETPFFLKKGENPDNVKLNLVIDGSGTTWIDDIRLLKGPLGQ
jgi:hypothetical protein